MMADQLLKQLDDAWTRWLTVLDQIDPARRDEKVLDDNWSVKDLVAHNLFWDAEVLTDIQRWLHGLPPISNDWQRMNDENYAAHRNRPYDLLRVEMHLVHQTVRDAVEALPGDLEPDFIERIAADTWDHYDDHTQQIEVRLRK
jgi:hypothetical protein